MRAKWLWMVPLVIFQAGAAPPDAPEPDLVVHEWGTFLAMSGSNGVSLDGMYHEEHALPWFVHARSRDQLRLHSIFTKGETPVIYFYTPRLQNAQVEVKFPRGTWTQWFPQSRYVLPRLAQLPVPATNTPHDGRIVWSIQILPAPAKDLSPQPPETSSDALWNFARDVDAAFVQTYNPLKPPPSVETERFLFYRGLGTAPLPLRMSADAGGTLTADASGPGVKHVFILNVEEGKAAFSYYPALAPGETIRGVVPSLAKGSPLEEFNGAIADQLAERLVESGLYPKEARAMVNTWRSSYFGTEGVRALFVLPQSWTDEFIPLTINPTPKAVTRVMVGRMELLTPERERLAEAAVRDLASQDTSKRLAAFQTLNAQGRYVEPIVRRVVATTRDEKVRDLCRRLLLADFVTDLRSAVRSPVATNAVPFAMVLNEEPVYIRARLAELLREVGLNGEAKDEGAAALVELKTRQPVPPNNCEARHDLKAFALALEGTGDDRGAAEQYGRLVALGGLAVRTQECRKCHQQQGAEFAARPRDWWAGEAYIRVVERSNGLAKEIKANEPLLGQRARRDGARLRLAYLYRAFGRLAESEVLWSALGAAPTPITMENPKTAPALQR